MAAKWYILQAYTNLEKKVAEAIKTEASQQGLEDKFEEVLVPTEEVTEVRKGRKVSSERKYFPGYVLLKMDMAAGHFSASDRYKKLRERAYEYSWLLEQLGRAE